jgi:hypothetical protein
MVEESYKQVAIVGTALSHYSSIIDIINQIIEARGKIALHFACARETLRQLDFWSRSIKQTFTLRILRRTHLS